MMRIWTTAALVCWASAAAAECHPEHREMFASAVSALADGHVSVAAARLAALVRLEPDCAEVHHNLAVVEVEQGRLAEAAGELRRALDLRPDYQRARVNLRRVEALLARQAPPTAPQTATAAPSTPTAGPSASPTVQAAVDMAERVVNAPPPAPAAEDRAGQQGSETRAPEGRPACVIDTEQHRVCTYRHAVDHLVPDDCFPIAGVRVGAWPRWVIAGGKDGTSIRMFDEAGRLAFTIIRTRGAVTGDAVRLRPRDFDSLASRIEPWRTAFVVAEKAVPADPAIVAEVTAALEQWRSRWERKQFVEYLSLYSQDFVPQAPLDIDHWRAHKRHLFEQPGRTAVEIAPPSIFVVDGGARVIAVFERWYRSPTSTTHDLKALGWQREGQTWKISADTILKQNIPDS